jgi:ABC-type sugar transport system permease subunit
MMNLSVESKDRGVAAGKAVRTKRMRDEARIGLIFLSPWLLGFILLKALPILVAFVISLTDFYMLDPAATKFIGLENYQRFFHDASAGSSLFSSLGYFLLTVPLEMVVALLLAAVFTNPRLKNKAILRTLIFMTSIIPASSIFLILLGSADYLDRLVIQRFNLPPLDQFAILVPFIALWSIGPGFLIMLGAMESVPREIYEAARVDGAGPVARFIYITLPMISPAIFFTLVINLTGAFGGSLLLDRGYIFNFSLSPIEGYINQIMFLNSDLGYASTLAWMTFLLAMTLTLFLFRTSRQWVYFPEDDENAEI